MGANGGADEDLGVTGIGKGGSWLLIEEGGVWEGSSILDLGGGKSSNEDNLSVPVGLEDLTGWELRDIKLLVGISDISSSSDHLVVNNGDDSLDSNNVRGEDKTLEHIDLGSLDLVVSILLVPESVLVEPVIGLGLGVKRISEVWWSRWSNPVGWSLRAQKVINEFLILSLVVLLNDTEISSGGA